MPQNAIAHPGSALATSANALPACGNQKLWNMARARLNCCCASALHEIGKLHLADATSSGWCAAIGPETTVNDRKPAARWVSRRAIIIAFSFVGGWVVADSGTVDLFVRPGRGNGQTEAPRSSIQ